MDNYPEFQNLVIFLLRSSNSIEFFFAGILLYKFLQHITDTPLYNVIKKIAWSLMILGVVREIASIYDYFFGNNAGTYTLLVNTVVYAYIIYILTRILNIVRKTDYGGVKFNDVIDDMIHNLNLAIEKVEKKSN